MISKIKRPNSVSIFQADLNTLTDGFYMLYCGENATNKPTNAAGVLMSVGYGADGKLGQMFIDYAGNVFTRARNWNTWTSWTRIS